ncbi:phosphopantetheine-binding protein [Streptomyces sp. NPDC057806]|uniref:phosphopantetheine-binding protein n=1 Tax=unclassified Streptomyces TaxID=2593676 RepID=UPI002020FFF6|nr:phosphopantetheine-binding protein [Streptomyces sp. YS415]MCL7426160.1 phosphopantetheine-binding protein [Streptomyces sp. YS415]
MSDQLTPGHALLLEFVDLPELLDGIGRDDDLTTAGLNSGDLIRLALAIEERTGSPLDDDELTALHTVEGIDQVLTARSASVSEAR